MNCKKVKKYLPLYYDRALPDELINQIDLHYAGCDRCKTEIHEYIGLQQLAEQARNATGPTPDTARFIERLQEKLGHEHRRLVHARYWNYATAACIIIVFAILFFGRNGSKPHSEPLQIASETVAPIAVPEPEQVETAVEVQPEEEQEDLAAYMTRMANKADYQAIPNPSTPGSAVVTYATDDPNIKIVWIYN